MGALSLDKSGQVATITLESPPANALSSELLTELSKEIETLLTNKDVKAIIIRGDGKFFSVGADIKEFTSLKGVGDHEALARKAQAVFEEINSFPVPVIAAIHGAALGGGLELAMACDMRIVAKQAKLGLPELNLGIIPGFSGTQRLGKHVGHAKAYEMILTGESINGEEAVHIGLANHAVEDDNVYLTAKRLAEKIAAKSKYTITKVMELVPYAASHSFDEGLQKEAKAFGEAFSNEDAKEGIQAFMEKRSAAFTDK